MRNTFIAIVICTVNLLLPCAHAQQSEANRQALAQLRAKAENGDAQSQFELGLAFYSGKFGLGTNYVEAVKCFRKAAEQNYARAQYNLGWTYYEGKGIAMNDADVGKWWHGAVEQSDALAQNNVGLCYDNGLGVTKDPTSGCCWRRRKAMSWPRIRRLNWSVR